MRKTYGVGDFRSPECIELLKEADIVVTNPPFSLLREFIAQLVEYNKKFLIIGNISSISYKEIFPLFKDNKIWLGISIHSGDRKFRLKSYIDPIEFDENGDEYVKVPGVRWFTNLTINYKQEPIALKEYYTPEKYPKYDNYDAINVDKVADIPCDYPGVMGVPISFMDKYCPEQFRILGISGAQCTCDLNQKIDYSKYIGYHQDGTKNGRTGSTFGNCPVLIQNDMKHDYYKNLDKEVQATYIRVFARNKHPQWNDSRYKKIIKYYFPEKYIPALTGCEIVNYIKKITG